MGTDSDSTSNGWGRARGFVVKAAVLIGGTVLLKRLTKSKTRWDHARIVADSLGGEKFSREQASRDPGNFFNIRHCGGLLGSPFDRFYMVKPCPKDLKCDVEASSYAIREVEQYKNFCDHPKDQRPLPEEVIGDIGEHLTTIYLRHCDHGKHCLYKGSTPPGGFPNSWVWGVKEGPYEFKPAPGSSFNDIFSPLNFSTPQSMEKRMEGSFVVQE